MKKKLEFSVFNCAVILMLVIGCNKEQPVNSLSQELKFSAPRAGTPTTFPKLISSSGEKGGRISAVPIGSQLFAFAGSNLFRIHTDDRSYSVIGVDWNGTEAATIMSGYLFAVQGGHLWRCDLSSTNCVDLGAAWGGTSSLTNDGSFLYGIQGGRIWKVNFNGGWAQLGNGSWRAGWIACNRSTNPPSLLVTQPDGFWWQVNTSNGSWVNRFGNDVWPYVFPDPPSATLLGQPGMFAVSLFNQRPIVAKRVPPSSIGANDYIAPGDLTSYSTARDIAWTSYGNTSKSIWVLNGDQIFQLTANINAFNYFPMGATITGLSGVYQIVSQQSR
ncbi:MAG: hypothetical protein ACKO96_44695 [Flammeovirgaceae bacterium]